MTDYKDAGVDIEAGDAAVKRIATLAKETANDNVLASVGGLVPNCCWHCNVMRMKRWGLIWSQWWPMICSHPVPSHCFSLIIWPLIILM